MGVGNTVEAFSGTERFDIRRELGSGAWGVVYEAFDKRLGSAVALKTLEKTGAHSLYRFKREFRELAGVVHPHLVTLYELFTADDRWFFTMEFVEGLDFMHHVRGFTQLLPSTQTSDQPAEEAKREVETLLETSSGTSGAIRPIDASGASAPTPAEMERLRDALFQLAEGVHALHTAKKLHRDLKPSNVRVRGDGHVVLLDFGLVMPMMEAESGRPMRLAGTPVYMSPEQTSATVLTEASDWYGVGIMLYQALTGKIPLSGMGRTAMFAAKQNFDMEPPGTFVPGLPKDLDALCAELLRRKPSQRPSGEEVLARLNPDQHISEVRLAPAQQSAEAGPFVGRRSELGDLHAAFERTDRGSPEVVWINGPSGMGKSALMHHFLDEVRQRDGRAIVLAGRCYQQESVPYKGIDSIIDALSGYLDSIPTYEAQAYLPRDVVALAQLFPVIGQVEAMALTPQRVVSVADAAEVRRRAFVALRELFARIAARRPLIIAIDDLQWGDADSGSLLGALLRSPEPPALLLIGTCRSDEAAGSPLLQRIGDDIEHATLELQPLGSEDVRELVGALGVGDDAERVETILRESGGSPFFVRELTQGVAATSDLSLEGVLLARIESVKDSARRLLEVLSVAGQPLDSAVAVGAAELGDEGPAAVAELRSAQLLRERSVAGNERIEPYHDRIRETITASLSDDVERDIRRRLVQVVQSTEDADPEFLAAHLGAIGEGGKAGEYAAEAARRAADALAFDRAAQLYRMAIKYAPDASGELFELRVGLARALTNAGRGKEAGLAYLQAARLADTDDALELRRLAADALMCCGEVDKGIRVVRAVLQSVGLSLPKTAGRALASVVWQSIKIKLRGLGYTERAEADIPREVLQKIDVCMTVTRGFMGIEPNTAMAFATRTALLALKAGEPGRIAWSVPVRAVYESAVTGADVTKAFAVSGPAAETSGDPYAAAQVEGMRGLREFFVGNFAAAVQHCDRSEAMLREGCTGVAFDLFTMQSIANNALSFLGEWGELCRRYDEQIQHAEETGNLYGAAIHHLSLAWIKHIAADDPDAADAVVDEILGRYSGSAMHLQKYLATNSRMWLDLYRGRPRRALDHLDRAWPALKRAGIFRVRLMKFLSYMQKIICTISASFESSRERAQLLARARRDIRVLRRIKFHIAPLQANHLAACVALIEGGDEEAALRAFEELEEGGRKTGIKTAVMGGRRSRGLLIGGDEGAALVKEADDWHADQGIQRPDRFAQLFSPWMADH